MAIDDEGFSDENPKVCTVLGGCSFIGKSLVSMLLKSERWIVRIADRSASLVLDRREENSILSDAISTCRASYFQVDVREKSQVREAIKGSVVVFHMDTLDSSVNDFYRHYMLIVQGTKNVINACRECKVKKLVYNSSADVIFDGVHSIVNGDESLPYPWKYKDMLSDLRSQAEALVLFANGTDGLLTCALRPSNVFGPGERHFIPFLIGEAKSFRAKFFVGNGGNLCDFTYVDNVAHAHICAEETLHPGVTSVAGKAFFITNLEPLKIIDYVSLILDGLGFPRPWIHLPAKIVLITVVLLEWVHKKFDLRICGCSQLNSSMVHFLSSTRTFNCSCAQKQLQYSPIVSLEEGVALTIDSYSDLAADSPYMKYRDHYHPSKAEKLLGCGRVADLLLWRDEKKTFTFLLALFFLLSWFFLSGRTFISSMARLLVMVSVVFFIHGILPSTMLGFTIEKISSSYFEVSETMLKDRLISIASTWNKGAVCTIRTLARGDDWNFFLKVVGSLFFLKLLSSFSLPVLTSVGLVLLFTTFIVYEQCEEEVDNLLITFHVSIKKLEELVMRNLPPFLLEFLASNQIPDDKLWQKHQ